ncbi:MBL fold metallo-hydrolase [Novosphingopyxis sp.]|uniref:MBL fold metallo-hydrolase n=1 Tax=Novosphingopyxis sp. TaxID=2709690 RepID=UPI003B5AD69C
MRAKNLRIAIMALALSPSAPTNPVAAQVPAERPANFVRVKLGAFVVTVLSDGTTSIPFDELLMGISPQKIKQVFGEAGEKPDRSTSINAFLIDTGERRILIDTGAGTLFGKCCGRLPETLASAGYEPDQIDAVLLTHVHGDHSGGLVNQGKRVFPNAEIYLDKVESDFWMSDVERDHAEARHKKMFKEGRAALAPYQAAGKVRLFRGRTQLFPGITAIPAPGHTPGHSFYEIESEGHVLRVVGDIVHAEEVQLTKPAATITYDINPAQAAKTRKTALAELARSHQLVAADHISFPGLGHFVKTSDGYRWAALPYDAGVEQVGKRSPLLIFCGIFDQ